MFGTDRNSELGESSVVLDAQESLYFSDGNSEGQPVDGEAGETEDLVSSEWCSKLLESLHSIGPPEIAANYHQGDVLLLHGKAYSSSNWDSINTINILAAQGFKAIAIDLPGLGKTPPLSLKDVNKEVFIQCVMKKFELDNPFLVSPSFSGVYAIPYVLKHFETLAGFIPIAPSGAANVDTTQYENITTPTLILYGSRDKAGAEISNNFLSYIPHSTIYSISKAGHACYLENPREFHVQLVKFIIKNKRRN